MTSPKPCSACSPTPNASATLRCPGQARRDGAPQRAAPDPNSCSLTAAVRAALGQLQRRRGGGITIVQCYQGFMGAWRRRRRHAAPRRRDGRCSIWSVPRRSGSNGRSRVAAIRKAHRAPVARRGSASRGASRSNRTNTACAPPGSVPPAPRWRLLNRLAMLSAALWLPSTDSNPRRAATFPEPVPDAPSGPIADLHPAAPRTAAPPPASQTGDSKPTHETISADEPRPLPKPEAAVPARRRPRRAGGRRPDAVAAVDGGGPGRGPAPWTPPRRPIRAPGRRRPRKRAKPASPPPRLWPRCLPTSTRPTRCQGHHFRRGFRRGQRRPAQRSGKTAGASPRTNRQAAGEDAERNADDRPAGRASDRHPRRRAACTGLARKEIAPPLPASRRSPLRTGEAAAVRRPSSPSDAAVCARLRADSRRPGQRVCA